MKKYLLLLLVAFTAVALLSSCRSKKSAVETNTQISAEEATWKNVTVPVRLELLEPQKISFSGRATLVRDEYVYISVRMLGFEVAQLYVSPTEADVVIKQINKMWIQEPIGEKFARLNLPFQVLQEAMLGEPKAIERLPKNLDLTVSGTKTSPVLTLKAGAKGKSVTGRMTLSLSEAQWDSTRPATFSAPGSDYKKTNLKGLKDALPSL